MSDMIPEDDVQSIISLPLSLAASIPLPSDSMALEKLAELNHKIGMLEKMMKTLMDSVANVNVAAAVNVSGPPVVVNRLKKHKNMTDAGVRRKAKFIFYNEYKTNPALLDTLTARLSTAGLLKYRKKGDVDVMDVPWTLIKQCTDAEFDSLSEENKMIWYAKVVRPS